MQPPNWAPREAFTTADIEALLAGNIEVSAGLELLDSDDTFLEDISDDLEGGEIKRGNYQDIHGTCRLRIARQLDWGSQRVRPYMVITREVSSVQLVTVAAAPPVLPQTLPFYLSGVTTEYRTVAVRESARFNLGVYLLATPVSQYGETPMTYEVEGYDKLLVLRTPIGETWQSTTSDGILASANELIVEGAGGDLKVYLADIGNDTNLPAARTWPIAEENTYLKVVNEHLAMLGYRALWVDWDGWFRSEPYESPATRGVEWWYDADDSRLTIVGEDRSETVDLFDTPNRWVVIRSDPLETAPAVDDGIAEVVNQSDGPSSIDARGRTITRIITVDAATQTSLEAIAQRYKDEGMQYATFLELLTGPNPLHWHFDVVSFTADGITRKFSEQEWTLPLDGSDMTHRWRLT